MELTQHIMPHLQKLEEDVMSPCPSRVVTRNPEKKFASVTAVVKAFVCDEAQLVKPPHHSVADAGALCE